MWSRLNFIRFLFAETGIESQRLEIYLGKVLRKSINYHHRELNAISRERIELQTKKRRINRDYWGSCYQLISHYISPACTLSFLCWCQLQVCVSFAVARSEAKFEVCSSSARFRGKGNIDNVTKSLSVTTLNIDTIRKTDITELSQTSNSCAVINHEEFWGQRLTEVLLNEQISKIEIRGFINKTM